MAELQNKRTFLPVLAIALFVAACSGGNGSSANAFMSSGAALTQCQAAMKAASKYPDKAEIPFVSDHGGETEGYFAWGASTEHMMLMNGLGLMAPASGSCIINKITKQITSLTINGQTII